MIESARITRGNIKQIEKLFASDFDALVIPGGWILYKFSIEKKIKFHLTIFLLGFGAAKNL